MEWTEKMKDGRFDNVSQHLIVSCWCLAKSTTTAVLLLLLLDPLTPKESPTNRDSIVHLHSVDF